jgi:hypothetical protein
MTLKVRVQILIKDINQYFLKRILKIINRKDQKTNNEFSLESSNNLSFNPGFLTYSVYLCWSHGKSQVC